MGSVGVICLLWESVLLVTGERFFCYGKAFFLLRESVSHVTGERFSCYVRQTFLLDEQIFLPPVSVFQLLRKCI